MASPDLLEVADMVGVPPIKDVDEPGSTGAILGSVGVELVAKNCLHVASSKP